MGRKKIKSNYIASINYHDRILEIEFKNSGEILQYFNIEEWLYTSLMKARSKTLFFNKFIKTMYEFNKIGMN